jgi:hypothetical protein
MAKHFRQSAKSVLYLGIHIFFSCVLLPIILVSCSANQHIQTVSSQYSAETNETRYSIICIIHGDGDYLYHDTNGNIHNADEETLAEVKLIALQNPFAEVFIFHQKSAGNILFFFPQRDGDFFYYRNGNLFAHESYWRDEEQSHLIPETKLYHRFVSQNRYDQVRMFMYFGHEIPEFNSAGYDDSYPDRTFKVRDLAIGLNNFLGDSVKFNLMILSTCYGGTPYTISTLGSFAQTIIASPENLHLSYFDLKPFERLNITLQKQSIQTFAKQFAQQAFDHLSENIQTAVSVAVYDVSSVQKYINSVHGVYDQTLTTLNKKTKEFLSSTDHCDCADLPEYIFPGMSNGVTVFYRAARFGRLNNKPSHSGWECLINK